MARRKDTNWSIPEGTVDLDQAQLTVLMDLRDELKTLNRVFACPNFVGIPRKLDRIVRNTTKRRRVKK